MVITPHQDGSATSPVFRITADGPARLCLADSHAQGVQASWFDIIGEPPDGTSEMTALPPPQ